MTKIVNLTKKRIIAEDCKVYDTILEKALGLMFQTRMRAPLLFIFPKEKRWSFHMFFVFFPIDIVFLDSKKKVVDLKENFLPWTTYTPKSACVYAIEMPVGRIRESKTAIDDELSF